MQTAPATTNETGIPVASQQSSLKELVGMLFGPVIRIRVAPLLSDPDADPGLFGPDSITWRVAREPLLLLGGGRALLMQLAHPLIAQGVVDHSDLETDPLGRLVRTARWLIAVTFGTRAEARAAIREVNVLHRRVRGTLEPRNAAAEYAADAAYTAGDPELARWVHATIVQSMLVTHDTLVGSLAPRDRDEMVREWNAVAELMGIAGDRLWRDAADLDRYIEAMTASLRGVPPASRSTGAMVLHPPLPSPLLRPVFGFVAHLTVGMLPDVMRPEFSTRWTRAHAVAYAMVTRPTRAVHRILPARWHSSSLYQLAVDRAAGRYGGKPA
jgi:uncharacterized protein (DUF2236 family)